MRKFVLNNLPYFICLAGIYNVLFKLIGIDYLYAILMIVGIVLILFTDEVKIYKITDFLFLFFVLFVLLNTVVSYLLYNKDLNIILRGLVMYLLPIIFWFMFYKTNQCFNIDKLVLKLRLHVALIAILGIVQYYFSPSLFGLLLSDSNMSDNILWANDANDKSYMLFFRATSFLTSPQIFGAFIALYFVYYNSILKRHTFLTSLFSVLLLISGAHSGNKSFFLIVLLFFLIQSIRKKSYIKLLTIFFLLITFLITINLSEISFIKRVFSNSDLFEEEKYGRLQIWKESLSNINFFGVGPGTSISTSITQNNIVTESYFLQILSELGIIPFIFFILILMFNRNKIKNEEILLCFEFSVLSMFFVQAFPHPSFIIFWGILFYGFNKSNSPTNFKSVES